MVVALACQLAAQSVITVRYSSYGLGNHDDTIPLPDLFKILELSWVFTTPAILSSIIARLSICILLVKIFSAKKAFVRYCYVATAITTVTATLTIIVVWVQCRPVDALWHSELEMEGRARCWKPAVQQDIAILSQALLSFTDLTFVLFPVLIVWKLNMSLMKKASLIGVLSLGLFTMAASILKTVTSQSSTATQYNATLALLWSSLEQSFVITMGCIPPLIAIKQLDWHLLRSFRSSLRSLIRSQTSSDSETIGKESSSHLGVHGADVSNDEVTHLSTHRNIAELESQNGLEKEKKNSGGSTTPIDVQGDNRWHDAYLDT